TQPEGSTPVPAATATNAPSVQPSGGITHTVGEGDTLFDIALKNNKSVEENKRLNNLTNDILNIAKVLVSKPPPETLLVAPAEAATASITPTVTPTPGAGALCVQAYF